MGVTQKVWRQFQRQCSVVVSKEIRIALIIRKGTGNWLRIINVPLFLSVLPVYLSILWGSGLSDLKKDIVPLKTYERSIKNDQKQDILSIKRITQGASYIGTVAWAGLVLGNESSDCFHLPFASSVAERSGRSQARFPSVKVNWKISTYLGVLSPCKYLVLVQSKTLLNTLGECVRLLASSVLLFTSVPSVLPASVIISLSRQRLQFGKNKQTNKKQLSGERENITEFY